MKPNLIPGARTLDKESRRRTRPSVSRLRNEGIKLFRRSSADIGAGLVFGPVVPEYGSICRKSSVRSNTRVSKVFQGEEVGGCDGRGGRGDKRMEERGMEGTVWIVFDDQDIVFLEDGV